MLMPSPHAWPLGTSPGGRDPPAVPTWVPHLLEGRGQSQRPW